MSAETPVDIIYKELLDRFEWAEDKISLRLVANGIHSALKDAETGQHASNTASPKLPSLEECETYYGNHIGFNLDFDQKHIIGHVHEFIKRQLQA